MAEKWIVPCNIKYFNIIEHLKTNQTAVWKNSFTIKTGDTIYIYIGAPYGEIKYRCRVISDSVSDELLQQNPYAIQKQPARNFYSSKKPKYIQFEMEYEYPEGTLSLNRLREHGLGQVQIQARTDRQLQKFIDSVDMSLEGGAKE